MSSKIHIAVFASGQGSNARNIAKYFQHHPTIEVSLLLSNKSNSGIPDISTDFSIPHVIFNRDEFYVKNDVLDILHQYKIKYVVLAGFLWLVPEKLVKAFPERIINIHPSLLPAFGGKGMYGMNVHTAVKESGATSTGITIHLVNEEYDKGQVLFQASTNVTDSDSPEDIAHKVHELEYQHFPNVIEKYVLSVGR